MSCLIFLIMIITVLIIYRYKTNKVTKKILNCYVIWTLVILFISTLNPYKLFCVSDKVYALWIINIIITTFTILIFSTKEEIKENEVDIKYNKNLINSKNFMIVEIITCIFLIYYKIKYSNIINNLSTEYIRLARYNNLFSSGVEKIFFDYILVNVLKISLIITSISIVNGRIMSKGSLITILNLIIYTTIGYGRMIIFEFVIYILMAVLIFKTNIAEKINLKKIMMIFVLLCICLMAGAIITTLRTAGISNVNINSVFEYGISEQLKQIVIYFTGGFRALDSFLTNGFSTIKDLIYIRLSFGGIEDLIGLVLNNIGYNFKTINSLIVKITQTPILIGEGIYFNAFYTCVMNFYGDLGYLGVIIFPIIHGLLVVYAINNYIRKKDLIAYILLAYTILNLICSIYRWNYQSGNNMIVIIVLLILNKLLGEKKNDKSTLDS